MHPPLHSLETGLIHPILIHRFCRMTIQIPFSAVVLVGILTLFLLSLTTTNQNCQIPYPLSRVNHLRVNLLYLQKATEELIIIIIIIYLTLLQLFHYIKEPLLIKIKNCSVHKTFEEMKILPFLKQKQRKKVLSSNQMMRINREVLVPLTEECNSNHSFHTHSTPHTQQRILLTPHLQHLIHSLPLLLLKILRLFSLRL